MDNPLLEPALSLLRQRQSVKWRRYGDDVLPLWVAEMDVLPPPPVRHAVARALEIGDTGYVGTDAMARAYAGFAARHWGWEPDPARARMVPDVMLGITEVLKLVTGPDDPVVVNSPVYPPFYAFVRHLGRRVVEAPLGDDGRLDAASLTEALDEAARGPGRAAYLLCSPHNPTGTVHTREELTMAGTLARQRGVRVVVDEIHAPLVYAAGGFTPYLALPVGSDAFALGSGSKAFNLAGLKAALALAGQEAQAELARMPEEVGHGASHVAALAQAAVLTDGDPWLAALLRGLDDNRRLLGSLLAEHLPQVGYREPEGTYLAWLDCRELGLGAEPATAFRERAGVALTPGRRFGTGGPGHARLNFATSPAILTEAVRRMGRCR